MTIEDVRNRVAKLFDEYDVTELWRDVLQTISEGADDPVGLAKAALE